MVGSYESDSLRLGVFLAVWAVLWIATAIFASPLRRRLLQHHAPLDAPVDLDAYDWAYVAGETERVLDAALVKMITGGHLRIQWEHPRLRTAHKPKAAPDTTGKREPSPVAAMQGVQALSAEVHSGVPVRPEPSGGETTAADSSKIVKSVKGLQLQALVDGPLPPDAHPVEVKLYATLVNRPAPWKHACREALRTLEDGFKDRLRRQDLLANPVPITCSAPPPLLFLLNLAWCIFAIIYMAKNGPGSKAMTGKPTPLVIVPMLWLFLSFPMHLPLMPYCHLNRRGQHVLAQAMARAPVLGASPAPAELALAVALLGTSRLPPLWPLSQLYPPPSEPPPPPVC